MTTPGDAEVPLSDEWLAEIERRLEAIDSGAETTIPWTQIRDEAIAKFHGKDHPSP